MERVLRLTKESFGVLFDHAPVMMHAVDNEGKLVKVNGRWLQTLGYKSGEVLGRWNVEFLTEESRARAVTDALPLFWRVGSARSVGLQIVRSDGLVVDVLVDAEVCFPAIGGCSAYASLYDLLDINQWEQVYTAISAVQQFTRVQHEMERILFANGSDAPRTEILAAHQPSARPLEAGSTREALGSLLELTQDISVSLRGLVRAQEEWLSTTVDQQHEMLLLIRSIGKTLESVADAVPTPPGTNRVAFRLPWYASPCAKGRLFVTQPPRTRRPPAC